MSPGDSQPDHEFERRVPARLLDVLIRAGLIAGLAVLCYTVFAPFLTLMAWAVILAITIYPLQQSLARRIGGKQGLAATIVVAVGCVLIVVLFAVLWQLFALRGEVSTLQAQMTTMQSELAVLTQRIDARLTAIEQKLP